MAFFDDILKKTTTSTPQKEGLFSDILGLPDFRVAQTTPPVALTSDVGKARLPFGKEEREIPGGKIPALGISLIGGLLEAIPKAGVMALAEAKKGGFLAKGEATPTDYKAKPEPLDLSFLDAGKRLGFDSNKIQDRATAFMGSFTKRQQENQDDFSDKKFYKDFALSYGKEVILPILDIFVAGSVVTSLAKAGLKTTTVDPITKYAIKEMKLKPSEWTDVEVIRYAFNRQWETIVGRNGNVEELNRLGGATQHLLNKIYGGEEIKGLNKLGEFVQKASRTFLSDMSLVTNRLPMGLSIEDVSKQLPAKIEEAGKLVEQIKQAKGDIQKAQGIFSGIQKATSISGAENLLGQLKDMSPIIKPDDITSSISKAKQAGQSFDEWMKGQGEIVYHGRTKKGGDLVATKDGELGQGLYFSSKKEFAEKFAIPNDSFAITGETIEIPINKLKIKTIPKDEFLIEKRKLPFGSDLKDIRAKYIQEGFDGIKIAEENQGIIFPEVLNKIKTRSQLKAEWDKAIKIPKAPVISSKTKLIQSAKKMTEDDLKSLAQKLKSKDITKSKFEELVLEAEFAEQVIEGNAAKELAKYSPKRGDFAGKLKEVTGKKGEGIFAEKGDQLVTELGFGSSEDARKAFELYKKQKVQLDIIKKQITELRKTKASIGKGERLMKLAMADRRMRLRAVKDAFNLTDSELSKLRKGRDITAMSQSEFNKFIEEAEIFAEKAEATREARISLQATIHEKELKKWENVQKAMKLPPINKMSIEQLNQLNEILSQYKNADEFLTQRQLETIDNTELKGLRTTREVLKHLADKLYLSIDDLPNIKPHPWMYDTQLARQHPLYDLLVDKYNVSFLKATGRIIELENEVNDLIKASRKFQLVPTDKNIVKWLEATAEERRIMKLSESELKAAQRMDEIFRDYYGWLTKRAMDKKFISRFEDKYFPHTRRSFLEAWKEDGFLKGVKEAFDQFKQEEKMLTILDEKTGDILPYEKWIRFSQFRTGNLTPTQNAAKAFKAYITALEKARQFDEFIPEIMIYVHALTPKELTPKGLKMNDSLQRFIKSWINSKKGRVQKQMVTPGGKMDWALRMGVAITRIKDLGLNIPVGIANIFGEQAGNLTMLRSSYPVGIARLNTFKGKEIIKKYENFVGQSLWHKLTEASNTADDQLLKGIFGVFNIASRTGNKIFLLGSMTPEEWAKGEISIERLAYLRKKMGKYRVVEGAESIFGKSAEAAVGGQYKKWAIPIIISTKDNAIKLASILRKKGIKAALSSEEGAELFFSVILGSAVGLGIMGYYNELKDKKDRNFVEDIIYKSGRDSLSMIGALNPRFLASFAAPRLASLIVDLGEVLENIILFEKYKTNGELKGLKQLKEITTPAFTRPFFREEKKETGGIKFDFGGQKMQGITPIKFNF